MAADQDSREALNPARAHGNAMFGILLHCSCFESNLNGEYHTDPLDNDYYRGIIWELWRGDYSLKSARMMVRQLDYYVDNQEYKSDYGGS